jgi:hypothetical protein
MGLLDLFRGKRRRTPGTRVQASGQYTWSQFPHDQVTCNKGDPLPPPPRINWDQTGGYWELTDKTRTSHNKEDRYA